MFRPASLQHRAAIWSPACKSSAALLGGSAVAVLLVTASTVGGAA
ncbi:MAG: hypothetical protein RIR79_577 [Pseudomonadota bacterium]|jgi:hypothetical protein